MPDHSTRRPPSILARLTALTARMSRDLAPREKRQLVVALAVMVVLAGAQVVPALAVGEVVDALAQLAVPTALAWAALLAVAYVLMVGLGFVRHRLVENLATHAEKARRIALVDRLLRLDIAFYNGTPTGELNGQVSRSVQGLVKLLKLVYLDFVPAALLVTVALVTLWVQAPVSIALLATGAVLLTFWIVAVQIHSQDGIRTDLEASKNRLDGVLVELLGAIASVRALHTEVREMLRVETVSEHLRGRELEHHYAMSRFDAAKLAVSLLTTGGVVALGGLAIYHGDATAGEVITFVLLLGGVFGPLRDVHRILDEGHEAGIQIDTYYALLDEEPDLSFAIPRSGTLPIPGAPALHLRNIHFQYREDAPPVLQNINMDIHPGEFVGICGPSGSGKSTLVQLAPRVYHPTSGELHLFGHPAEQLSREESAALVGYVAQTPFLTSGTVEDNITYGSPPVRHGDIEAAARAAALHHEIVARSEGYQTLAENLSGGQRQRVALARVFLQAPPLIILDEATSALDTVTERRVMEHFHELRRRGCAVVAVAHRLATLRDTDRILVVDAGKIVEVGTYEALLSLGGTFSDLAEHGPYEF